jgi:hypothetical protein
MIQINILSTSLDIIMIQMEYKIKEAATLKLDQT